MCRTVFYLSVALLLAACNSSGSSGGSSKNDEGNNPPSSKPALGGVRSVAVSPNGRQVFAAGYSDNAITVYDRSTDGTLAFKAVFKDNTSGVDGLGGAWFVTVAPDGKQVFVASDGDNALAVFDRTADGTLTFKKVFKDDANGVDGLGGARKVAVSHDNKQVFVAGYRDNALAVFDRSTDGTLTFKTVFKDGVSGVDGLDGARFVAVSSDDKQVFVAGYRDNALAVFDRATDGTLTFKTAFKDGAGGVDGLKGASSVTVTPTTSGKQQVFVTGYFAHALAVFDRTAATGELTFKQVFKDDFVGGSADGLWGAAAVSVSPDGNKVYVAGGYDDALAVFDRTRDTGELAFKKAIKDASGDVDGLDGATSVALSHEGKKQVFVAGYQDNELAVFDRSTDAPDFTRVYKSKNRYAGIDGYSGAAPLTVPQDNKRVFVASERNKH